jgi:hypothetical protein
MKFVEIEMKERRGEWAMSELQTHDYYELYFLIDGEREFFFEDRVFGLKNSAFCVIPPYSKHKTSGGGYKRININISPSLLSEREVEFLEKCTDSVAFSLSDGVAALIIPLLKRGAEISVISPEEKQSLSLAYTHTILHLLASDSLSGISNSATTGDKGRDEAMLRVAAYINENYTEPLTLEQLANHFYISKNTLSSRVKT